MATVTPTVDEEIWDSTGDVRDLWHAEDVMREQVPEPQVLVIFGATGDLAHRKLVPAIYQLAASDLLPDRFAVVGFGRSEQDTQEFVQGLRQAVEGTGALGDDQSWDDFARHIIYFSGQYHDCDSFKQLGQVLDQIDQQHGTEDHRLFYLATPPSVYSDVVDNLGASGLNRPTQPNGWVRLIVEKPFGRDLASARRLDRCIHEVFDESQVYRIDHYLGKETVQNIFVLRFINGIFEPLWNRNYVDHVQITAAESLGVEGRGSYYETAGAIRDMLQSHLLQLLTLTAMEPPSAFTADKVRDEKVKVLDSLILPQPVDVVRGQYGRNAIDGQLLPGYREEKNVAPDSTTETFVAAKLMIDNWRWAGVPFYLRTGKRMPKRLSEIAIQFRRAPQVFLPDGAAQHPQRNALILRIQPNDGLALRIDVKVPGPGMRVRPVDMSFLYNDAFGDSSAGAYQRLLLDAMRGDSTLFSRTDEVEGAWRLMEPLLEAPWDAPPVYPAGGWGPREADNLLARESRHWRQP